MDRFELDWDGVVAATGEFIRKQIDAAGRARGVIGLSGGIDSSVSAYLTARAIGADRLMALMMPYRTSSPESLADATLVAEALGIEHEVIEITPMVDAYFGLFPDAGRLRRANMMARQRMAVLYDQSERLDALVVGTGNRTEALLGYTTMWGDMACAFNPVGGLYKSQVRALARHLGVPERIIAKPPTADLWSGQTDEGELGFTYAEADRLLIDLVERRLSQAELLAAGHAPELVARVRRMIVSSQFKRRMPVIAKLTDRTINWDFRYPRDWTS